MGFDNALLGGGLGHLITIGLYLVISLLFLQRRGWL
jgi:hypothetical protein